MSRPLATLVLLMLGGGLVPAARAQDAHSAAPNKGVSCGDCHTCEKPTPTSLCLRGCIRAAAREPREAALKRGPDVVILDELEELYLPVPFDHRGHAEMAKMTIGCAVCHHHTPEGNVHPACKTCHEVSPKRRGERDIEEMRKPGLKAAYHRQCMNCHREWSHETACGICHSPKTGKDRKVPTPKTLLGDMHPPIPEPDIEIYKLKSKPDVGENVIFRHRDHIHRFGLRCVECHQEESCSRCHEVGKKHEQRVRTVEEHHAPCSGCHGVNSKDQCRRCHWKEGAPQPPQFNHAETGWPLDRYHTDKSCRACHRGPRFVKQDRDCNACHSGWDPDGFDHGVTGQVLDENHEEIDCADCHTDRKFDVKPKCDECHDEDEGFVFPTKRPGPAPQT